MIATKDQTGRKVSIENNPSRIISVVPSQTELLFDLGLNDEVIGITKFCVHPDEWFRTKARVGGTKNLTIEKIKSLQPDLIIANKEENDEKQIKSLENKFPVWVSDIKNLSDALQMIHEISTITGTKANGDTIIKSYMNFHYCNQPKKKSLVCI
jgi:ABC-type Fe3+-hydroxamate transport system substrate-binding protein